MGKILLGYSLFALASAGSCAYAGYCNAKGIPLDHEFALKYGPAIAHAAVGAPPFLFGVGDYVLSKGRYQAEGGVGVAVCILGGGALLGAGILESLVGYGIGYAVGKVS
ncbi:hypothetical protein HY837_00670 [archaeon]|nr:hypothetical protein [archaeon]